MTKYSLVDIDVAKTKLADSVALDRVGMSQIECPVMVSSGGSELAITPARVDAYVDLHASHKGIHMSRLFLIVEKRLTTKPLSPALLVEVAEEFLRTHVDISSSAHVRVNFDLMIRRPALLSKNSGWRTYPVSLWASVGPHVRVGADLVVRYSSTCPCSAALSRQLIQKQFDQDFAHDEDLKSSDVRKWLGTEQAIAGTPHGQRSEGRIQTELKAPASSVDFLSDIIEVLEKALGTPVQTVVKREDEQEFARLNAANLMFAEDAARRMHVALRGLGFLSGTFVEAAHIESLHPHDAVAKVGSGTLRDQF